MTLDYVTFTKERIARLRAEADALERNLKEFQVALARSQTPARKGGGETSAFGFILESLSAAGPEGMTLDEMIEAAAVGGFNVKRNTLRSQLWGAKNDGKVVSSEPGRFATARPTLAFVDDFDDEPPAPAKEAFTADLDDEIPF
jgi:hypothetical protein